MDGVPLKKLSLCQVFSLEEQFSKEEIRVAVFSLGGDNASSPEGFPIIFSNNFGICLMICLSSSMSYMKIGL